MNTIEEKSDLHDLILELEKLRDKWSEKAYFLEKICGEENPIAKAIRLCIADLGNEL